MTERKEGKTVRLYEHDSMISSFDGIVLSCEQDEEKYKVILDRTAFFPEGGGQTCDTGYIGDASVTAVYLKDDCVIHVTDAPVQIGKTLLCSLNYKERLEKNAKPYRRAYSFLGYKREMGLQKRRLPFRLT